MLISAGKIRKIGNVNEVIDTYLSFNERDNKGTVDLVNHPGRKGSQKIKLLKIELRNQNDQITGTFFLKDELRINLFLEAYEYRRSVGIVVELLDYSGNRICSMYDSDSGFSLVDVFGKIHISLVLKDIRLYPGRYHISVSVISEILNYKYDSFDELENAISFDVENQLISTRALTRHDGLLLLTPEWYDHRQ
jgi:hypothetical protein